MVGKDGKTTDLAPMAADQAADPRAPWISPQVIVSRLSDAKAHVSNGADGSSSGYRYGS